MLHNFFRTAFRNILKYKAYSVINFTGLTCGLALALLILSYVRHELSFDRFHQRADRLYRLSYTVPNGLRLASTPPPIAPLLAEFYPGVERAARVYGRNVSVTRGDRPDGESFEENGLMFADSALMNMFDIRFITGDPRTALREPYTLLITEETAKRYFGTANPVGQTLVFGAKHPFRVAAVVKDLPPNSHLRFGMLAPWENMYDIEEPETRAVLRQNLALNFVISHCYTYVLMKPGHGADEVNRSMPEFLKKYCPPNRMIGQVFSLMPLTDIHLKSDLMQEPSAVNTMSNIYLFSGIGMLTLIIACINFINLATAQSFTRVKEIGIRKILGSGRHELMFQFLSESFLFCLVSFVLSFAVFYLTLPVMSLLVGSEMTFADVADGELFFCSVLLLLAVTILAGGYPAWFVSRFSSVQSLKGDQGIAAGGSKVLRRTLVVFQLMIACALLSGSLMLIRQLHYLESRPLGFQKDHMLTIPLSSQNLNAIFARADSTFRGRIQTFRNRAEALANVESTTLSAASPGFGAVYRGTVPEGFTQEDNLFIADLGVEFDFIKQFGMKMVAGRDFDRAFGTDEKEAFIVNEAAVREFRWNTPQEALGKTINREGKKGKVIGVVSDFNSQSLTAPIGAIILEIDPDQWTAISVKLRDQEVKPTVDRLRSEWNSLFPEKTFEFSFLDEQLNQQYSGYANFGNVIGIFTAIAILISCLGVYGLVLFVVQRKVKEIGVRKVMGATASNILRLIFREFAVLIGIGFLLAIPLSWYFIDQWLQNFQFRTTISASPYLVSFGVILLIVSVTISYHSIRAALGNPVNALRSE